MYTMLGDREVYIYARNRGSNKYAQSIEHRDIIVQQVYYITVDRALSREYERAGNHHNEKGLPVS